MSWVRRFLTSRIPQQPDDGEEQRRAISAVEPLIVTPITPPLQTETWFRFPGEFSFGLPRGFAVPSQEIIRLWESRNGAALICAEDAAAPDYPVAFLMVQRNDGLIARDREVRGLS